MNADRLLAALSNIGDDPACIQQLRKIAVALAISGKLDGHAVSLRPAEIIEAVDRVKATLVKRGALPKQKKHAEVTEEQLPEAFADPSRFAPLGELARIERGKTGIQQAQPGPFPLVVTAAERASCDHYDFEGAAAIIPLVSSTGHGNASLNRLHYQDGQFALGTILAAVFPHDPSLTSARFLFEYLSAFKNELLVSRMTGTANVTLTIGGIGEVPIPLVCPEVQKKLDELMALCDRLDAARGEREKTRDRLAAASLARLNDPDPETFQTDARFVLDSMSAMTARPDQIKQLRQTILNLAVRGKLVPQDPNDEPASAVLKKLGKASNGSKLRRGVPAEVRRPPAVDMSDLPSSWSLEPTARLLSTGAIIDLKDGNHGANHPKVSDFTKVGLPFITAAQVLDDGSIDYDGAYKVSGRPLDKLRVGFAKPRDLIYTHKGTVGRVAICTMACVLTPQTTYYRLNEVVMIPEFLGVYMRSALFRDQVDAVKKQTTRDFVSISAQYEFFIRIPPLVEQHRIVAKVDELMAICYRLEASLTAGEDARTRLLDALLHEALVPASDELSAA